MRSVSTNDCYENEINVAVEQAECSQTLTRPQTNQSRDSHLTQVKSTCVVCLQALLVLTIIIVIIIVVYIVASACTPDASEPRANNETHAKISHASFEKNEFLSWRERRETRVYNQHGQASNNLSIMEDIDKRKNDILTDHNQGTNKNDKKDSENRAPLYYQSSSRNKRKRRFRKSIWNAVIESARCEHVELIDCEEYETDEMSCMVTATGMSCCVCSGRLKTLSARIRRRHRPA